MHQRIVSAPGKVIVSGEHAVVYGYPALLAALDWRLEVRAQSEQDVFSSEFIDEVTTADSLGDVLQVLQRVSKKTISLESALPMGSGLGSSAALAVSVAALCLPETASLEEINALAYQLEKIQHGQPSGGDNTVSCYGGVVWYRKESERSKFFQTITPIKKFPQFWLLDSGVPVESTKVMVELVRDRRAVKKTKVEAAFREMEKISRGWLQFLMDEQTLDLNDLLRENHRALQALGVVSADTENLIKEIEKIGGSAKITGAGGKRDGSGMVLVYHQDTTQLRAWSKNKEISLRPVRLGGPGLKQERK